jgi:protein involved in polysaccharide export with SLBB domain
MDGENPMRYLIDAVGRIVCILLLVRCFRSLATIAGKRLLRRFASRNDISMRCMSLRAERSNLRLQSRDLRNAVLGAWVLCIVSSCSSRYDCTAGRPPEPTGPPRVNLSAGDVLDVRFFYTPELNVVQAVRPDGKIALQLVGEVAVQGKSPDEVRDELIELYQPHLREPDVAVIVQSFYHRRVFVDGEVLRPGTVAMPGQMTVLDAIMEAGGFRLPTAHVENVVILRRQDDVRYGYCVDLRPALRGGEVLPFDLQPEDVVYVPQTRITEIGQWIDQHINRIIPQTGLTVLTTTGDTIIGYDLR